VADTAVVPLQDVLCLDGAARMNTPAVAGGNWSWRARPDAFREDIAGRVKMLVGLYDR
jgi:4-alpha-glucanotransferase